MPKPKAEFDRILERIQKLFALAASPNQAEAEAALKKAHELLERYNLGIGACESGTEEDAIGNEDFSAVDRRTSWKCFLLSAVAQANYCRAYLDGGYAWPAFLKRLSLGIVFVGKEHNIAACRAMAEYVLEVVERLVGERRRRGGEGLDSYRKGLADSLTKRIGALREEAVRACGKGKELIVKEDGAIEAWMEDHGIAKRPFNPGRRRDEAYDRGWKDGEEVSLCRQLAGRRPKAGTGVLPPSAQ